MKKFLSILLALAVGFTFTFGSAMSAFAATTPAEQIAAKAALEKEALADDVDEAVSAIVYDQKGYVALPETYKGISKTVVDKVAAEVKADYVAKIELEARNQTIANVFNGAKLEAAWADIANDKDKVYNAIFGDKAYVAQYSIEKEAALAELAKIDANEYNAFDYNGTNSSDKYVVAAAVKTAQEAINEIAAPKTKDAAQTAISAVAAAVKTAKDTIAKYTKLADQEKDLAKAKEDAKDAIDAAAKAFKEKMTAEYEKAIENGTTPSDISEAKANLAALDTNIAAVVAKYETRIANAAIDKDNTVDQAKATVAAATVAALEIFKDADKFEAELKTLGDIDALVDYAKSYAETLKTELNSDGTMVYTAEAVDEQLDAVIKDIKAGTIKDLATVRTELRKATTIADAKDALDAAKKEAITKLTAKYPATNYNSDEAEKVADLLKAATKSINAAADKAAVKAAEEAADAELAKVMTSKQIDDLEKDVLKALVDFKYATAKDGKGGALEGYFNAMAAQNPTKDYTAAKNGVLEAAAKVFYDAVLAKNNPELKYAEVASIVKDNYAAALAVIDVAKDADAIKAMAKEVVDTINAIPTTVDLTAKDAVKAAHDAMDAYDKTPGSVDTLITNKSTLLAAEKKLVDAELKALKDQKAALDKKVSAKTITPADEDAVKALEEAIEAYNTEYKDYTGYENGYNPDLASIKEAVDKAKFTDAANKLNALPANVTAEDADAVKAAREAFDKLTDAQKKDMNAGLVQKLEAAEAAIAALTKVTDDDVKAYLNTLKVTVKSAKTSKKNVKVTAKVTVKATGEAADFTKFTDAGYTFKYKFYRSTKTTVKYTVKKAKDTTTWTNTAGKKGTKYYYKVKVFAYDKDGNFVGQTYQSQCNYTSKVFGK